MFSGKYQTFKLSKSNLNARAAANSFTISDFGRFSRNSSLTSFYGKDVVLSHLQRWSPRGHILKFLALASKVKSLASKPQVLENWPVLGSRTALFFELFKHCGALEKHFGKSFFVEIAWKIFWKTFFFWDRLKNFCEDLFFFFEIAWKFLVKTFFFLESTCASLVSLVLGLEHSCPWPRECLSSERLFLASDFFCVLGLEPCVLDSTSGH